MTNSETLLIDVSRLQIGLFVHLDLGWMDHPFSLSSFKIRSRDQIEALQQLGVTQIRYEPSKSDVQPLSPTAAAEVNLPPPRPQDDKPSPEMQAKLDRQARLQQQRESLQACERKFTEATRQFKQVTKEAATRPVPSRELAEVVIGGFLQELVGDNEVAIRLLSEKNGDEGVQHSLNVTVLSLLLGKTAGLDDVAMQELGVGALLHDLGKIELADRFRYFEDHFNSAEREMYQRHVPLGTELGKKMGLPPSALLAIAQHHERCDGSGFPLHLKGDRLAASSKIVAIVNCYDNLCNAHHPSASLTPHEVLRLMFAKMRPHFDSTMLNHFIKLMGVYPPGSVVQLVDDQYAIVVSVNAHRPLKPRIIIYDAQIPAEQAMVVDMEFVPEIGIKRSLQPIQLPKNVFDYLSPRKRMCYFFERGHVVVDSEASA